MTQQKTTVASALQSAINPARYQLAIAEDKTDGIANTSVTAAISMLNQAEQLVLDAYNAEVDEFNDLCEELELTQKTLDQKEQELASLQSSIDDLQIDAKTKIAEAEREKAQARLSHATLKDKLEELKRLQAMQPEKLKSRVATLRKKVAEKQSLLDQQRINIRDLKNKLVDAETKKNVMVQTNTELTTEVEELRSRLMHKDGDVINKEFIGSDGVLKCYIHVFEYGLSIRPEASTIKIINDLDWYYEVKTNHGLNVTVSVTEWLQPFYPPCDYLADRWPTDIHDALHELIINRVECTHPHLIERMEWAKETYLEDADLDTKHLEALNSAGFYSVYSVLHIPSPRLRTIIKEKAGDAAKGFGEAAVKQIYSKLEQLVEQWQRQHDSWSDLNRQPKAA